MRRGFYLALVVTTGLLASPPSPRAADGCMSDWSIAAPIVKREGLTTVEALTKEIRRRLSVDVVSATLCQTGPSYRYRVVVREQGGHLKTLDLDARPPFGP